MQYVYKSNHINRTLLKGTCSSMHSYNPVLCYLPYTLYMFETRTFQLSPSGKTFSFYWFKWLTSHLQLFWNMMKLLNAPTKQYNAKHLRLFFCIFQQWTDLLILLTCAVFFHILNRILALTLFSWIFLVQIAIFRHSEFCFFVEARLFWWVFSENN